MRTDTRLVRCAGAVLIVLSAGNAWGAVVTSNLMDGTRDTGWKIEYDDTKVTSVAFVGIESGQLKGNLTIEKTFSTSTPIDIKFVETAAEQALANSFGLRVNIFEKIKNSTTDNWIGYKIELIDTSPLANRDNTAHPDYAHFHPSPEAYLAPPFALVGKDVDAAADGNRAKTLIYGNGQFAAGTMQNWGNFGLHQYENKDVDRSFLMRQTPLVFGVPEPSTMLLVLCGLAPMALRWRRWSAAGARCRA